MVREGHRDRLMGGSPSELAPLVQHADHRTKLGEAIPEAEGPPPFEIHSRLIGAQPGPGIPFEEGLHFGRRTRRDVLSHRVLEGGRRDQTAPARLSPVFGVAEQRIIVAVAEGEVTGSVPTHFEVVGRISERLMDADPLPRAGEGFVGQNAVAVAVGLGHEITCSSLVEIAAPGVARPHRGRASPDRNRRGGIVGARGRPGSGFDSKASGLPILPPKL